MRKWLKLTVKAKSSIFGWILNVTMLIPLFSNASSLQKHYDTHTLWYLTYIVSKPNFKEHFAYSTSNVTSVPKNEVFHISSVNTENIINGKSCLFYSVFSQNTDLKEKLRPYIKQKNLHHKLVVVFSQ